MRALFDVSVLIALLDAYLLALAVHHGGRLVTLDRNVPTAAVDGAEPRHLVIL